MFSWMLASERICSSLGRSSTKYNFTSSYSYCDHASNMMNLRTMFLELHKPMFEFLFLTS